MTTFHIISTVPREEDESPERHAFNLSEKMRLLRNVKQQLGASVAFVPVKVYKLCLSLEDLAG